jgi:sigma-B regulation protein RsbU (phosphoserine phosphatase)
MFVALIYARFDLEQMNLTCAVAGMEPPFFIRGAGRQVAEIEASGMVLGVLPEVVYEEKTMALMPGDTIVFFTDGTVEAQNQQGEEFGSARLREAAAAADARDLSAQGLADRLMELILSFSTTFGRKDDMTILVAKVLEKQ